MKLFLVVLLCVCYFSTIKAVPDGRDKRATGIKECESTKTDDECKADVEKKNKEALANGRCEKYVGVRHIAYFSCGSYQCPTGYELIRNSTKPYPDCCPSGCENRANGQKITFN